jgi:hypothetical protein
MDEVVLHQHREKSLGSDIGNQSVQIMLMVLVISDGLAVNKLLYEDFISRFRKSLGESDVFINNIGVKLIYVSFLLGEVKLFG